MDAGLFQRGTYFFGASISSLLLGLDRRVPSGVGGRARGARNPHAAASTIDPAPASAASAMPVTVPTPAPKRAKRRRPSTFSYVNRPYGVAFSFPRQYNLKAGDEAQLSWRDLGPFQMDFVQPGGVTLAAVELPDNSMKNTKFVVRVNRGGPHATEYVQRIDRTPIRTIPDRKLVLVMGRFTAEDAVKSIQNSRCISELVSVQISA